MSTNPTATASDGPATRLPRPRTIDYAVWAIVARCVFALGAAFALYGTREEARRTVAKANPTWTAQQIENYISSAFRSSTVITIVASLLVLLLAKLIRDGRNWSRWLFAVLVFIVLGDVQRVFALVVSGSIPFRILSGLTGLAAIAALVLLFVPTSNSHFRRPGAAAVSPLRALLGARTQPLRPTGTGPTRGARTLKAPSRTGVDAATVNSRVDVDPASPGPTRPTPRAKSRKQRSE